MVAILTWTIKLFDMILVLFVDYAWEIRKMLVRDEGLAIAEEGKLAEIWQFARPFTSWSNIVADEYDIPVTTCSLLV